MFAQRFINIDTICLPDGFSEASRLVQEYFPAISLKEFDDDNYGFESMPAQSLVCLHISVAVAAVVLLYHFKVKITILKYL